MCHSIQCLRWHWLEAADFVTNTDVICISYYNIPQVFAIFQKLN